MCRITCSKAGISSGRRRLRSVSSVPAELARPCSRALGSRENPAHSTAMTALLALPTALCEPSDGGLVAALALRSGVPTETLGTVLQHGQR